MSIKKISFAVILFVIVSVTSSFAQDKFDYHHFDRLMEIKGTEYVVATIENMGKMAGVKNTFLLFVNTRDGQVTQVDFGKDSHIQSVEQLKLDTLGINKLIVRARTVNLNHDKTIDFNDPTQVILLSPDGKERIQVTADGFFTRILQINHQTGAMVITGYYDSNNNGKYDRSDRNEILVVDLKTGSLVARV